MSNGYRSNDDLLADSADADRNRSFAGEDWGDLIASGHMDIEDAWDMVEEETEEDIQRREWRENWPGSLDQHRYNYISFGTIAEGYVPSEQDKIDKQKEADSYKNAVEVYF